MPWFWISVGAVALVFAVVAIRSARGVGGADDFSVSGRSASASAVCGVIIGSFVAGSSTLGTVQMAYQYGARAIWFNLGGSLGCLALAAWFALPARSAEISTLPEIIERHYGRAPALVAMAAGTIGSLFAVIAQFMSGRALIAQIWPLDDYASTAVIAAALIAFVFAGGIKGYASIAAMKTVLLCVMLGSCVIGACAAGLTPPVIASLPSAPWLDIFADGTLSSLGSCFSLATGVICTQIYMQAVFSARDVRTARVGSLAAGLLIFPLGAAGVYAGLALRASGVEIEPARALPYFLSAHFHPALAGVFWAALAVTIIGGASGICLGIATNVALDVAASLTSMRRDDPRVVPLMRASVVASTLIAAAMSHFVGGRLILEFGIMSVGLRGAGMFVPLVAAVICPRVLSRSSALASAVAGLVVTMLAWLFVPSVEPLFAGLAASGLAAFAVERARPRGAPSA